MDHDVRPAPRTVGNGGESWSIRTTHASPRHHRPPPSPPSFPRGGNPAPKTGRPSPSQSANCAKRER